MGAVPVWEPVDRLHSVTARPLRDDDSVRVVRFFDRLSRETVYRRFFSAMPRLNDRVLHQLVDIDHDRREAMVAVCRDEIIGLASYERRTDAPGIAEVAVVVEDGWQRHGVGAFLLRQLGYRARVAGVTVFDATVLSTNDAPVKLARTTSPDVQLLFDGIETHLTIPIVA